jgi:hypothetical protein
VRLSECAPSSLRTVHCHMQRWDFAELTPRAWHTPLLLGRGPWSGLVMICGRRRSVQRTAILVQIS